MTRERCGVLVAILTSSVLLAGCGPGGGPASSAGAAGRVIPPGDTFDNLTVTFASEPDPPQAGENTFEVTIRQGDGSPLTDATVITVFAMPPMPAMNMPAMRTEATLRHEADGRYRGTGELSMGGTWNVTVTMSRGAEELGTRRLSIVASE